MVARKTYFAPTYTIGTLKNTIKNAEEFREVVRKAPKGVLMAVCGHEHVDRLEKKEDVWYYCVNSMSYYWTGSRYG